MPVLTQRKRVPCDVVVGMRCDCCGREFDAETASFHDFRLRHTFGYDSVADMTSVEATICDDCLLALVLDHVPGAVLVGSFGEGALGAEGRAALKERLARRRAESAAEAPDGA